MENKIATKKITTSLWFNTNAEEAVNFYISVFKNSKKGKTVYYGTEGKEIHGMDAGTILTIDFELEGRGFVALNGGPHFKFNEAISFIVNCETQEELDYYWDALKEGGDPKAQQCGWLKDKFGVSWQIVPTILEGMLQDGTSTISNKVMAALLKMKKIDIKGLQDAANS